MFTVSVAFGNISWLLAFHKEEDAKNAAEQLMAARSNSAVGVGMITTVAETVSITDDFGQTIQCKTAPSAIFVEDLAKSKVLQIDYRMHQARIQNEFQKRAESDAGMRAARGPSVLTPMPIAPMRTA